jgi:hypothetical protein
MAKKKPDTSFNFGANVKRPARKKPTRSSGGKRGNKGNAWRAYVGGGK